MGAFENESSHVSPRMSLDGINFYCRGRWTHKLELSQKLMNTPCATSEWGLIFYLDLEPTFFKHRNCTSSNHSWHLCKAICKYHQGFKRSRADTKYSQCLNLDCDLDLEPTLVKPRHCTLCHHTLRLCKVIWKSHQGFKRYRADTKMWRMDWQTDGRTDRQRS